MLRVVLLLPLLLFTACAPAVGTLGVASALRAELPALQHEGIASWYGPGFAGRLTANGEIFDPNELTAAHRTLPFGTRVRVVNLANGQSVVVRINDRGPFKPGRIIDLSRAAAERIGLVRSGTGQVRIELVSGVAGVVTAAADASLARYEVAARGRRQGELLVLSSEQRPSPVLVRVVSGAVPSDADADLLMSSELYAELGPVVKVDSEAL